NRQMCVKSQTAGLPGNMLGSIAVLVLFLTSRPRHMTLPGLDLASSLRTFTRRAAACALGALLALFAATASADVTVLGITLIDSNTAMQKVPPGLLQAATPAGVSGKAWARASSSGTLVKVLIVAAPTADSSLASLRSAIVSAGGSVYYKYISLNAIYALL